MDFIFFSSGLPLSSLFSSPLLPSYSSAQSFDVIEGEAVHCPPLQPKSA